MKWEMKLIFVLLVMGAAAPPAQTQINSQSSSPWNQLIHKERRLVKLMKLTQPKSRKVIFLFDSMEIKD